MQRIYIPLDVNDHPCRAALTGIAQPTLSGILGAPLDVRVVFFRDALGEPLEETTTGKFVLKQKGARTEDALFLDVSMEPQGEGENAYYKFGGKLLSDELIAAIGEADELVLVGCVTWTEPDEDEDRCEDFEFVLKNSAARDDDSLPASTDARWAWLKAAAPEANGFTHDDEAKTLAVEVGGITEETDPIASAALASHAARTDNPHAVTKAQVGLGSVDNTADSAKPVSTAQQTALNLKANLASPALTGTPTAPTPISSVNTTQIATTAFVQTLAAQKAPLASPAFTGAPTAPTPSGGSADTSIATTAFIASGLTGKLDKSSNLSDLASAAAARSNLGIGAVNNTADADKPISTATQTALNAKEATQTAASQAEAEAGTETAIRKWSPLRIKQAIEALAPSVGGGANIVRGSATLNGWTTPGAPAQAPQALILPVMSLDQEFTFQVTVNGTAHDFTASLTDPTNGTVWIDSGGWSSVQNMIDGIIAAFNAQSISDTIATDEGTGAVFFTLSAAGASNSITGTVADLAGVGGMSGGGNGADGEAPTGDVSEVEVLAPATGKKTKPLKIGYFGSGDLAQTVRISLRVGGPGGSYPDICQDLPSGATSGEVTVGEFFANWMSGVTNAYVVARIIGAPPEGGTLTVWAIAEQA